MSAADLFVAITAVVLGLSHIVRASEWAEAYRRLAERGTSGAFVNGGLSLAAGAFLASTHSSLAWPDAVLTVFGWLNVAKGTLCFLAPAHGLRSMRRATPCGFVAGGLMLLSVGALAGYCVWRS